MPKNVVAQIREAVVALADAPRPPGARKLTGYEGYRVRVGDYRILYEIDDVAGRVRIYQIGHRKDVYR